MLGAGVERPAGAGAWPRSKNEDKCLGTFATRKQRAWPGGKTHAPQGPASSGTSSPPPKPPSEPWSPKSRATQQHCGAPACTSGDLGVSSSPGGCSTSLHSPAWGVQGQSHPRAPRAALPSPLLLASTQGPSLPWRPRVSPPEEGGRPWSPTRFGLPEQTPEEDSSTPMPL